MTKIFAVDSSCMVASIAGWDKRQEGARDEITRRLGRGERMTISAQALTETYAVLTRLPAPYFLSPAAAIEIIELTFLARGAVFALDAPARIELLRKLAKSGIIGGRTYDAIVGESARQAGATVLLTFNARHFDPPPAGVTIIEPST